MTVQSVPCADEHPFQFTKVEPPVADAVSVTVWPVVKVAEQVDGDEQVIPAGELGYGPGSSTRKSNTQNRQRSRRSATRAGRAIDEDVGRVADNVIAILVHLGENTTVPQPAPVGATMPVVETPTIWGMSDCQVTWFVMSIVWGG